MTKRGSKTTKQSKGINEGWYEKTFEEIVAPLKATLTPDQFASIKSVLVQNRLKDGRIEGELIIKAGLTYEEVEAEMKDKMRGFALDWGFYSAAFEQTLDRLANEQREVELAVSSVIIPMAKTVEGALIASITPIWMTIVERLKTDWAEAHKIPPHTWEEIIAGAFHKAGYDEVTLTPRSGDFGRDVIAIKHGIGCIKVIGSVKAYAPDRRVDQKDVRELLGVMSGELNTSKGIITTTGQFAPRIKSDPFIKPFLPTRLELVDGTKLQAWLTELLSKAYRPS